MRLNSILLGIFLSIYIFSLFTPPQPAGAVSSTPATTFYMISGEMCYGEGGFIGGYTISGKLGVRLTLFSPDTVRCETWGYLKEGESNNSMVMNVILTHRQESNGNYTLFFIDLPANATIHVNILDLNVVARYLGERYLSVGDKSVKTHYYCYVFNELQSILRFEWYFEAESGILLKFSKFIEVNFVKVQWLDYIVQNTTLSLAGTHPVSAFLANIRGDFFAGTGAIIAGLLFFYMLTLKKMQRSSPL